MNYGIDHLPEFHSAAVDVVAVVVLLLLLLLLNWYRYEVSFTMVCDVPSAKAMLRQSTTRSNTAYRMLSRFI